MKSNWKLLQPDISPLANLDISDLIKQLLVNRGIEEEDSAIKFLSPKPSPLHDPFLIFGMDKAVKRILKAVKNKKKIIIYGDYDVDGVSATSILWEFLFNKLKADVLPYIPNRVDEGYGLNVESVQKLIDNGADLIVTVDCGIRDKEIVAEFKGKVDFIVTDHHTVPDELPETIVIHPRHLKGNYPFGEISGGVVAWKLVTALKRKCGLESREEMIAGADLAAFSTVCDAMPLIDENREIVKLGLEDMKNSNRLGLNQMIQESGVKKSEIDAYHLGFVLGPRINAAGRLGNALDAVRLMVTENQGQAVQLAHYLGDLNKKRQEITKEILEDAEKQVLEFKPGNKLLFAYGKGWPEGIVGLVAGRLTEKYHKPTLVASLNGGLAVGSARSIPAFNIIEAIEKFGEKLVRYGGHAQAAGFTVAKNNIEDFRDSLQVLAQKIIKEEDMIGELEIDSKTNLSELTMDLVEEIGQLAPFGYGNKMPVFVSEKVEIESLRAIGTERQHLKIKVSQDGVEKDCIAFRMGDLISELEVGQKIDIVYNADINEWNGRRSVQLLLKDFGSFSE